MSNQANNKKQHPKLEASIELSDEQLEQVSGGDDGFRYAVRIWSDAPTLGLAEIYWHSKAGKKTWEKLKQEDKR